MWVWSRFHKSRNCEVVTWRTCVHKATHKRSIFVRLPHRGVAGHSVLYKEAAISKQRKHEQQQKRDNWVTTKHFHFTSPSSSSQISREGGRAMGLKARCCHLDPSLLAVRVPAVTWDEGRGDQIYMEDVINAKIQNLWSKMSIYGTHTRY